MRQPFLKTALWMGAGMLLAANSTAWAADVDSGPQVGDRIGVYTTLKCNAVDDGVKQGQRLCYT